ncbi:PLP-dependent aminotransferase family protein ['Paenibacillus yunnanensis' Narsing Rao et al. 2020]|uniref:MocR-like pyridoxine biosynthesis transcription factor PdxR n=1 Tax=Paenibacillus tengchongensis TaxID=2608684 RepID=UPI00124D87A0|nr:PLP-dependent aminotransferase family protein [Paenibacillus tengchongensis]
MQFHAAYCFYINRDFTKLKALYQAIRDAIHEGAVVYGEKLPSTRELAAAYHISRGIVNQAYDMLTSQGYLHSEHGRGTFVAYQSDIIHDHQQTVRSDTERLSAWGTRIQQLEQTAHYHVDEGAAWIDFSRYQPDLSKFPYDEWNNRLYAEVRNREQYTAAAAVSSLGEPKLREAIAAYLRRMRGIQTDAAHIAVTAGSMQAIALLTQLLADPGDHVVTESPSYVGISQAILAAGARLIEANLDGQGLVPQDWQARMLFVTPSRQFPTGEMLSLERRQTLLDWAHRQDAIIVEDDYDSEFRYRGMHVEPLKTLDKEGRVIYLGSFTKTLPFEVRLGYVVLPPALAEPFQKAQALYEPRPVNLIEQRALAEFMASGQYERHLRRMNRLYSRKFQVLLQLLKQELSAWLDWVENDAGLHVFGWWRGDAASYEAFQASARSEGVLFSEVSSSSALGTKYGIYLSFAHLSDAQLQEGVSRLVKAAGAAP